MPFFQINTSDITTKINDSAAHGLSIVEKSSGNLVLAAIHDSSNKFRGLADSIDVWEQIGINTWTQINTSDISTLPFIAQGISIIENSLGNLMLATMNDATPRNITLWERTSPTTWTQINTSDITTAPQNTTNTCVGGNDISIFETSSGTLVLAAIDSPTSGINGQIDIWKQTGASTWTKIDTSDINSATSPFVQSGIQIIENSSGSLILLSTHNTNNSSCNGPGRPDIWEQTGPSTWTQIDTSDVITNIEQLGGLGITENKAGNLILAALDDQGATSRIHLWEQTGPSTWTQIDTSDIITVPDCNNSVRVIDSCINGLTVASWRNDNRCIEVWHENLGRVCETGTFKG